MAKGVEDTAFYVYNRLLALNEVGGDPGTVRRVPRRVPRLTAREQERWPTQMLATVDARHQARARTSASGSALLSEMPERWAATVGPLADDERAAAAPTTGPTGTPST